MLHAVQRCRQRVTSAVSGLLAAALISLAGCSGAPQAAPADDAATSGDGGWSYTDMRGEQVVLDTPPERVIADTYTGASLWDFGLRPVGIFGWGLEENSHWSNTLGNVDLDAVETVGRGSELNIEAMAALNPDVIVGNGPIDPSNESEFPLIWVPENVQVPVAQLAPLIATKWWGISLDEAIEDHENLAAALGADVNTEELRQAKVAFEEAEQRLAKVAEGSNLRLLAMGSEAAEVWVGNPPFFVILRELSELGFEVVVPEEQDEAWEILSWEQIDRYPADVILYLGQNPLETGALDAQDLWRTLPAVQAGQVVSFNDKWPYSHVFYAQALDELATTLADFEAVTSDS